MCVCGGGGGGGGGGEGGEGQDKLGENEIGTETSEEDNQIYTITIECKDLP